VELVALFHAAFCERGTELQPPEIEPRRSQGAANLPQPKGTEGAAAVGSSEKLALVITAMSEKQFPHSQQSKN